jgi:siroheme synthase (precorrin-2 oxidase/ferrochelatase)
MKEKEEKEIDRRNINNEYILFLQDEKNEKKQKLEKQEKYRMILDEQINERKLNQLNKYKYI